MKFIFILLNVLFLIFIRPLQAIEVTNLSYTIQYPSISEKKEPKLIVTVKFETNNSEFEFFLPNTWAGILDYNKNICHIKALSTHTQIFDTSKSYIKKIVNKKKTPIIIEYTVSGKNSMPRHAYANRIHDDFFSFFGYGVFGYPEIDTFKNRPISIFWKIEEGKNIINSFSKNNLSQHLNISIQQLKHATYYGGDFVLSDIMIANNHIFLVSKNVSLRTNRHLEKYIKKIVSAQRNFWNDHNYHFYLISACHDDSLDSFYIGTKVENAIVLFFNENSFRFLKNLMFLVAHEHWHTWLGSGKLRQSYSNSMLDLWIHEGFSDYYAGITLLKSGLIPLQEYIDYYNEKLKDYFNSPYHKLTNAFIANQGYSNPEMLHIFYTRGHIAAHEIDFALKAQSNPVFNLDNIILNLYSRAQKEKNGFLTLSSVVFLNELKKYHVYVNEDKFYPSKDALGPCVYLELENENIPQYKLNKKIHQINPKQCLDYFN